MTPLACEFEDAAAALLLRRHCDAANVTVDGALSPIVVVAVVPVGDGEPPPAPPPSIAPSGDNDGDGGRTANPPIAPPPVAVT